MNQFKSFTQTIRFRLTLAYSLVVFIFCGLFLLSVNVLITAWVSQEPPPFKKPNQIEIIELFSDFKEIEKEKIFYYRNQDLFRIRQASAILLFPLAGASFIAGYILSGSMLFPLKQLNEKIKKTNIKNLAKKIDYSGPQDEIGDLITSYNNLVNRLHFSFMQQEQFVSDASHELKTPLTIIQTNLDSVLSDPNATKEELINASKIAIKGVNNLNNLINNLLTLALEKEEKEIVDLHKVITNQISELKNFALKRKVAINYLNKEKHYIYDNKLLISQAIFNLIENSIKYSKEKDGKVVITLSKSNNKLELKISDNGIGISSSDIDNVFERFFRADKSRSKSTMGYGLGLSIVKKAVDSCFGEIKVFSDKKSTVFTITLPIFEPKK